MVKRTTFILTSEDFLSMYKAWMEHNHGISDIPNGELSFYVDTQNSVQITVSEDV